MNTILLTIGLALSCWLIFQLGRLWEARKQQAFLNEIHAELATATQRMKKILGRTNV